MVLVLDFTAGGALANSYSSRPQLTAYIDSLVRPGAALTAADPLKDQALVESTRWLEREVPDLPGSPTFSSQALRMPRTSLYSFEGELLDHLTMAQVWLDIHGELAVNVINSASAWGALPGQGIDRVKAGPVEVDFDSLDRLETFPRRVQDLLRHAFFNFDPILSGDRVVPLVRR